MVLHLQHLVLVVVSLCIISRAVEVEAGDHNLRRVVKEETTTTKKNDDNSAIDNNNKHTNHLAVFNYGCSGSSAFVHMTRELIDAHGYHALGGKSEITKPQKNKYYESAKQKLLLAGNEEGHKLSQKRIVQEAMNQTILNAESHNQTVVFKVNPKNMGLVLDEQHGLRLMNVKFVQFYRSNYLDHALCEVRDCMVRGKPLGYPVFANGTRTDLCFFRRKNKNKHLKVQAYFTNPTVLVDYLKHWAERLEKEQSTIPYSKLSTGERFSAEDLYGFEYTNDAQVFERSKVEWMRLLSYTIDEPNEDVVVKFLKKYQGSLTLHPSKDLIYNYDEVVNALKDGGIDYYLNYPDDDENEPEPGPDVVQIEHPTAEEEVEGADLEDMIDEEEDTDDDDDDELELGKWKDEE